MQAAEKEASKDVSQTHPRTLSTVRDPTDANAPGPTSTLPIVDEAGEASSVGGHSQRSRQERQAEKDLPAIPDNDGSQQAEKGKERPREGQNDSNGF